MCGKSYVTAPAITANEPAKPLRDAQTGGSLFARNPLIFKGGKNN